MNNTSLIVVVCVLLAGCVSTTQDVSNLLVSIDHDVKRDNLSVNVTVTNMSSRFISVVDHPEIAAIDVTEVNGQSLRFFGEGKSFIDFGQASGSDVYMIPPGRSHTFTEHFGFRHRDGYTLFQKGFGRVPQDMFSPNPRRTSASRVSVQFRYLARWDFFPNNAWLYGRNYLDREIYASAEIDVPKQ